MVCAHQTCVCVRVCVCTVPCLRLARRRTHSDLIRTTAQQSNKWHLNFKPTRRRCADDDAAGGGGNAVRCMYCRAAHNGKRCARVRNVPRVQYVRIGTVTGTQHTSSHTHTLEGCDCCSVEKVCTRAHVLLLCSAREGCVHFSVVLVQALSRRRVVHPNRIWVLISSLCVARALFRT